METLFLPRAIINQLFHAAQESKDAKGCLRREDEIWFCDVLKDWKQLDLKHCFAVFKVIQAQEIDPNTDLDFSQPSLKRALYINLNEKGVLEILAFTKKSNSWEKISLSV